ncbi:MAG: 4-hydroxythreonine-4-phosphate dehydrogenase PdxA [Candidatus Edwardsbacteria bacterium]|jgi:4-hydroxythreonine-4-phosphate dehydrogenase|nr:4-hydroxythreonine-4-phosphate dehydrogenase PdxA [Candidatus Edwardsbacteria bacterium]
MAKPRIGITIGDVAGIGPEVAVKAALDRRVAAACQPVLIGPKEFWDMAAGQCRRSVAKLPMHDVYCDGFDVSPGTVSAQTGRIAAQSVAAGAVMALDGQVAALATAPISKWALRSAGYKQCGHTELLAELCRVEQVAMMFVSDSIRTTLATIHVDLARVPRLITRELLLDKLRLTERALRSFWGVRRPRIAVLGLNPHAGEDGMFGREEAETIAPAVAEAIDQGIAVVGPVSAEAGLTLARRGEVHALLAMYHDQGLLPLKMLGGSVNLTLGLPFVRTSPDHGTALDIAWRNAADPGPMVRAVLLAARLGPRTQRQARGQ